MLSADISTPPPALTRLLAAAYAGFNHRDAPAVLRTMQPDVAWPKAWEGGHVQGHAEVQAYWARQWAEIQPVVEPVGFTLLPDGRVRVEVQQTVRDLGGQLLGEGRVGHIYQFRDGLISQMDIEVAA